MKAPSTNNRELFPKEDNRRQKKTYLKTTNDQDGANRYDGLTRGE